MLSTPPSKTLPRHRSPQPLGLIGALAAVGLLSGVPNAAHAQVLFQQFTYPTDAPPAGMSWWQYASSELPALAKLGVAAVWHPVPTKGGSGAQSLGYDPYDLYDLGSKNQKGTVATHFGTKDEYLAYIAAAHANGLRIYADVVLNHAGGPDRVEADPIMAQLGMDDMPDLTKVPAALLPPEYSPTGPKKPRAWTGFFPVGADGRPGTGRFPRQWQNFHPSPIHPDRDAPYHAPEFGSDYCFEAQNGYVATQMIAWGRWFRAQTGVDGFRMDAVKLMEPTFLADFARSVGAAPASSTGNPFFYVGEFWDTNHDLLACYQDATRYRMSLFDFGLFYALWDMTEKPGQFDMRDLLKRRNTDRSRTVMFVSNHDVDRFQPINRQRRALPYAVEIVMAGRPSLFYRDYFGPEDRTLPATLERLVKVYNRFAIGREIVRFADADVLALEREKNLLGVFNDGGADGKTARTVTVPTGWGANVTLRSVGEPSGEGAEGQTTLTTDASGAATVTVPGGGYLLLVRADANETTNPDRFTPRRPLPTVQTTEFADDLDSGRLGPVPRTVRVTAAAGTGLTAALRTASAAATRQRVSLTLFGPQGQRIAARHGAAPITLSVPRLPLPGIYRLVAVEPGGRSGGTLTVTYQGVTAPPPASASLR